jgi:glycerate dehydrogenase
MNIVILDGLTIGKDINLDEIKKFGNLVFFETTSAENIIERIENAHIVISNKVILCENEFSKCKNLKLICVAATGYNNININDANKRNIAVTNVKNYSTDAVVQHLFAHLLNVTNSVSLYQQEIKSNFWQKSLIFTSLNYPITELKNKTLGIIGFGTIGKKVAEVAKVFGMNVLVSKSSDKNNNDNFRVDFNELLSKSDIITLHVPLNSDTKDLISEKEFFLMKKNAILINLARGGIVNEQSLFFALNNQQIAYAIVDVLTTEPPKDGNILFNCRW